MNDFDVDIVYLWVDGNDPEWRRKRNQFLGKTDEGSATDCEGRYADNDELKYSLRALQMNMPWIRRIHIVTDNQTPEWLNVRNPRIMVTDHKDIMPENILPVYNSTVIEHFLHRIPGLAEHFIYANDDMFVNHPVNKDDFFGKDGLPIVRLNRRPFRKATLWIKENILGKPLSNYNRTIQTSARLVENKYGRYFGAKTHHNMDSYLRSDLEHTFLMFRKEIEPVLCNHVRSDDDIQRNLYSYTAIAERRAHPVYVDQKTSFRFHIDNPHHYEKLKKYDPIFFCLNDSQYATPGHRKAVREFLSKKFPEKSEFEK